MATHQATQYDAPLLTINTVAAFLGVSRATVYRLIGSGDLRPTRVGERWRFPAAEIDSYLNRHTPSAR